MGVDKPNYTQIPNLMLDDLMMYMGEAELKVTLAIARQTFGYHRQTIKLSLGALQELTGMSRPSVVKGITEGMKRGTIEREKSDDRYTYGLIINDNAVQTSKEFLLVKNVNQEASKESLPPLVKNVDQSSKESLPELVKNVDQNTPVLKKVLKKEEKKKKERVAAQPTLADDVDFSRTPTAEKALTPQQEMYGAICEALGWDYHVITERNQVQVAQAVRILSKANYTVEDIRRFMTEIWFNDYRWTEKKSYPALSQLREGIGKLRSVAKQVAPPKRKGVDGYREMLAEQGIQI